MYNMSTVKLPIFKSTQMFYPTPPQEHRRGCQLYKVACLEIKLKNKNNARYQSITPTREEIRVSNYFYYKWNIQYVTLCGNVFSFFFMWQFFIGSDGFELLYLERRLLRIIHCPILIAFSDHGRSYNTDWNVKCGTKYKMHSHVGSIRGNLNLFKLVFSVF